MSPAEPNKIPTALNILIAAGAGALALMLLRAVSNSESWLVIAAGAIAFSFVANTLFSCLHECVHGIFHPNRRCNDAVGVLLAAFFPTGFSLQRAAHMGHHARNRSDEELFDYYYPDDSRLLKTVQWYGIISGVYWIFVVIGWWLYLLCPFLFSAKRWQRRGPAIAEHTSGPAYARSFSEAPPVRARLELLFTIAFQVGIFLALELNVAGWLICYLAFGLNWSALQYADHAFSPRDPIEGAWDLRVHPWIQAVFLNYHLHRAHHRQPALPWIHLPRHVDETRYRPRFLTHYLRMWRGPRPAPGGVVVADH
jgi:fatty acid desaturase